MKLILFNLLFIAFGLQQGFSQNITGQIIDSKTGESIPYANIQVNNTERLISNADGFFSVSEINSQDTAVIEVSYLGYITSTITVAQLKSQQNIIKLEPGMFELDAVAVSKPDPSSIMATVKKNLQSNYKTQDQASKEVLFYRESNFFKPTEFDIDITKSSGFTKKSLQVANDELTAFNSNLVSHPPSEFTDMLCNYYSNSKEDQAKKGLLNKVEALKATKLMDENQSANADDLQTIATSLLLKHLDPTKYYRVKSGLFGTRDTITLRKDFYKNRKIRNKRIEVTPPNSSLKRFISHNNFMLNNSLDFVNQPELYEYHYEAAVFSNENEFIYILTFKPKKSKAKYTGKLYISETDYAVIRADFTLADGKTLKELNMKFLFGIKSAENVSKGTLIFNRNESGIGYYLRYASREKGISFYINRPLKFIELTDSEKDVLAVDIKTEGNTLNRRELITISRAGITDAAFSEATEKSLKPIKLKKYDPSIWKGISTIEPLEEMKKFKTAN